MNHLRQTACNRQYILRVGCCDLGRQKRTYFSLFSTLEYQQSFFSPPKPALLAKLNDQAPHDFHFFLRAWQLITHEKTAASYRRLGRKLAYPLDQYGHFRPTPGVEEATTITLQAAQHLDAHGLVFETPSSFTPSPLHRAMITRYFETLPRQNRLMIWDPRGVWSTTEALAMCKDLQLVLCHDPFLIKPPLINDTCYWKLEQLGRLRTYSDDMLIQLIERSTSYARVYCLFHSISMMNEAKRLLALNAARTGSFC